jgi:hypothetical protein
LTVLFKSRIPVLLSLIAFLNDQSPTESVFDSRKKIFLANEHFTIWNRFVKKLISKLTSRLAKQTEKLYAIIPGVASHMLVQRDQF